MCQLVRRRVYLYFFNFRCFQFLCNHTCNIIYTYNYKPFIIPKQNVSPSGKLCSVVKLLTAVGVKIFLQKESLMRQYCAKVYIELKDFSLQKVHSRMFLDLFNYLWLSVYRRNIFQLDLGSYWMFATNLCGITN